ncbi:CAF17-like 4Fe-4S cluster assembly/insertion protein YgfZ [Wolbachia endosymbiont of Ctenocephalides felis wCfeJ]|uniref:CAF17-like 4Fe-4S cluster assembly/insertion protein YgfZ n=1 Tax=Wolbachia endosymbiont of Ctenocephalides felis wCfeJ TaxID=2732594 RepID=UPI00144648ED|nr:folate-binding protein YgfZ [Wolbachia endosymbiont of Ctenocephalides felis wCfeJ]WCR58547.1 MAG: tRNA-modifying protein YgfZ [Wolbachia endosymbiont of Ctenocephalides felis wCfeJ]
MSYIPLQSRGVIVLYGPDTRDFLQGIITNDINKLDSQKAIYSLLLSPQGKYLYDFFLIKHGKHILLECENTYLQQIIEKLDLLKTYLRVKIKDVSALYKVGVLFNTEHPSVIEVADTGIQPASHTGITPSLPNSSVTRWNDIAFQDPRHKSLGMRVIHKDEIKEPVGDFAQYEKVRIQNLVPDGAKDMVQNSSFPLQYLIDKVNGISFNKGCYIGQEVVNRMSRQETFRRKLYLVEGNSVLPTIGTKVMNENNEEVGELRSSVDNIGLALLNTGKSHSSLYADGVKISAC